MTDPFPALVSASWLWDRLNKDSIGVIDGSWYLPAMGRDPVAEFQAGHVPGAVHIDIDTVSIADGDLPHMMPEAAPFAGQMADYGIDLEQPIVVYDGMGLFSAPRVRWMLKAVGVREVAVLDGGFPAWVAADLPVETGLSALPPAPVRAAELKPGLIASLADMRAIVADGTAQVLDARPAGRFDGSVPEPRAGLRAGHMPGAFNVPLDQIVERGQLRSISDLHQIFAQAGVDPNKPVVASCGSGVTASVVLLALEQLGYSHDRLYDGSWSEWGGRADTPVVTD